MIAIKRTLGALLVAAAPFLFLPGIANAQTEQAVVEESYATALIRDTLTAVNQGNWTGNYTVLRDYASPDFAIANDPTRLAGLFTPLRARKLDLLPVMVTEPVIQKSELAAGRTQLRLSGYFPLKPSHVSFDLVYERAGSRWLLLGISVGAFDALDSESPKE